MPCQAEIVEFLARALPQNKCVVEAVGNASATVNHQIGSDELRPGGTVSGPVVGVCKLMKVGRSLAVGSVDLYSEGSHELVAHAVGTYSIPQQRQGVSQCDFRLPMGPGA